MEYDKLSDFVGEDVTIVYRPGGKENEPCYIVEGHVEACDGPYLNDAMKLSDVRSPITLPEGDWLSNQDIVSINPKDTLRLESMFFKTPPVAATASS